MQLLNQSVSSGQLALCSGVDLRYHSTQAPSYTGTVFPSWNAAKDRTQADTPTNTQNVMLHHSVVVFIIQQSINYRTFWGGSLQDSNCPVLCYAKFYHLNFLIISFETGNLYTLTI